MSETVNKSTLDPARSEVQPHAEGSQPIALPLRAPAEAIQLTPANDKTTVSLVLRLQVDMIYREPLAILAVPENNFHCFRQRLSSAASGL